MPRTYEVRRSSQDRTKWATWLLEPGKPPQRAHPDIRFDTPHQAQIIADALTAAFAAGQAETEPRPLPEPGAFRC